MQKEFKTILIVDDEPIVLEMIKEELEENYNCVCLTAENSTDASELLYDFEVDAAIIDIYMPNGAGEILANLVTIPYVIYTGNPNSKLVSRFQDKVIPKPAEIKDLYDKLWNKSV